MKIKDPLPIQGPKETIDPFPNQENYKPHSDPGEYRPPY
jgi:hypothetical protein